MNSAHDNREARRLAALAAAGLLDSPDEEVFDRLTRLAAKALGVPVALISLVDRDRQFFKSQVGLPSPYQEARETPLSHSFCQHVARTGQDLVVRDAREDSLVSSNLAIPDLGVIAYAGVPLTDARGNCFGSLCAIDSKPRTWSDGEVDLLRSLAASTMAEIEGKIRERSLKEDLTEMKRAEVERRVQSRLTVHDLRTPLNSLLLNLDVLTTLNLDAQQAEWAQLAQRSAQALAELVGDLVDIEAVATKGAGALFLGRCSPRDLVENAIRQVKGSAHSAHLEISLHADPLPDFEVDERKMTRVLVNLLGNAIKFTPANGRISVEARLRDAAHLEIAVTDNGMGFDQSQAEAIFEQGVTLDKQALSHQSTGWGLEFCKRTVSAHRGTIEVRSAIGRGSTFTLVIPLRQPDGVAPI